MTMTATAAVDLADLPTAHHVPLPDGVAARIVMRRDGGVHTVDGDSVEIVYRDGGQIAAIYVKES